MWPSSALCAAWSDSGLRSGLWFYAGGMGNVDLGHPPAHRPRQRWPLALAVVFTVAFFGALALVAVDLAVGRPLAGDLFVAGLNGAVAAALWVFRARGF